MKKIILLSLITCLSFSQTTFQLQIPQPSKIQSFSNINHGKSITLTFDYVAYYRGSQIDHYGYLAKNEAFHSLNETTFFEKNSDQEVVITPTLKLWRAYTRQGTTRNDFIFKFICTGTELISLIKLNHHVIFENPDGNCFNNDIVFFEDGFTDVIYSGDKLYIEWINQ